MVGCVKVTVENRSAGLAGVQDSLFAVSRVSGLEIQLCFIGEGALYHHSIEIVETSLDWPRGQSGYTGYTGQADMLQCVVPCEAHAIVQCL